MRNFFLKFTLPFVCILFVLSSCNKENNLSVSDSVSTDSRLKELIYKDVKMENGRLVFKDQIHYFRTLDIIDSLRSNFLPKYSDDFVNLEKALHDYSNSTIDNKLLDDVTNSLMPYSHILLLNKLGEVAIGNEIILYKTDKKFVIRNKDQAKLDRVHANPNEDCEYVVAKNVYNKSLDTRSGIGVEQKHENLNFSPSFTHNGRTHQFYQGVAIWFEYSYKAGNVYPFYRTITNIHVVFRTLVNGHWRQEENIPRSISFNVSGFVRHVNRFYPFSTSFATNTIENNFFFNSNNFPWIPNLNNLSKGEIWITLDYMQVYVYSYDSPKDLANIFNYHVKYSVGGINNFVQQSIGSNAFRQQNSPLWSN